MRRTWVLAAFVMLAALAGYARSTASVQAQGPAFPFQTGDIVGLSFADGDSSECLIEDIRGTFAKCVSPADRQGPTIGRREPPDRWVNVAVVEWVTRRSTQR